MSRQMLFTPFVLIGLVLAAACAGQPATPTPVPNMPNPASVYCERQGGRLDLRQDAAGAVAGVCVFPDKTECDEWAYYRGECQPGSTRPTEATGDGWRVYANSQLGYSFHYPLDAAISLADDPQASLAIEGPLVNGDYWPAIYLSHPSDRADFHPPDGADLAQWLTDHNLLQTGEGPSAEVRQPDLSLAGTSAIHTRLARSPQTYAYDKYFFAHAGQLYEIVILHTGDKEDWTVYNHFLNSIQFQW